MIAGLGQGFEDQFSKVQRGIKGMVDDLAPAMNVNLSGSPSAPLDGLGGRGSGNGVVNLGGIHITVYGASGSGASTEEIGRQAELGVRRQLRAVGLA